MKNLILILLMVVMFISCKKETAKISGNSSLTGKWDWISSSGGFVGETITPASHGDKVILEFTNNSIYRYFRNDALLIENKYHIIKSTPLIGSGSDLFIKIDGLSILRSYEIKSDTLILYDQCYDCYVSWYKRIE